MLDGLLPYFETELACLRKDARLFARQFPDAARSLGLSDGFCEDPDVEHLLEGLAFLSARIQRRIDHTQLDLAKSLLQTHCPDWLVSAPSSTVIQIQGNSPSCITIPAHTDFVVKQSGASVHLKTAFELIYQPLHVDQIQWMSASDAGSWTHSSTKPHHMVGICLSPFSLMNQSLNELIFWVSDVSNSAWAWWEYLILHSDNPWLEVDGQRIRMDRPIEPYGLGHQPGIQLWPRDSRTSYWQSLIQDYVNLPEAGRFFRIHLNAFDQSRLKQCRRLTIWIPLIGPVVDHTLRQLEQSIDTELFRLNCVPASNWHELGSDPIRTQSFKTDYAVRPSHKHADAFDVIRVHSVRLSTSSKSDSSLLIRELNSPRGVDLLYPPVDSAKTTDWIAKEVQTQGAEPNTWVVRLMVDPIDSKRIGNQTLSAKLLCHQRNTLNDLWSSAMHSNPLTHTFEGLTLSAKIVCKPSHYTPSVVHVSALNHLSMLVDARLTQILDGNGKKLRALLSSFVRHPSQAMKQRIDSLAGIKSSFQWKLFPGKPNGVWVSGYVITVEVESRQREHSHEWFWFLILDRCLSALCPLQEMIQVCIRDADSQSLLYKGAWRTGMWQMTQPNE